MRLPVLAAPLFRELRFWLTLGATLGAALAALLPPLQLERPTFHLLAVVDITGSMNTRDYTIAGNAVSRLDMMKEALRQMLTALPCQSRLGVAIFTERRPFLLFDPVEVCDNFETLDREISALDWRMAWEGDSYIASGLYRSVALADELGSDLIFMTDGQEAPPLPWIGRPRFEGKPSLVKGLIVGVGGYEPSPIPKFDDFGRQAGFWRPSEVPNENTVAPPPLGAEEREGFNPRNAPFGGKSVEGHEYLSAVNEGHLKELANETGLGYVHFETFQNLMSSLEGAAKLRRTPVAVGIKWIPAVLALGFLLVIYGVLPALDRRAAGLPFRRLTQPRGRTCPAKVESHPL
ncbi:VWA domain-containing protein [Beijerinckiaceae bacterium]|nr:VWA domain-containing protein [Beijerinckiaceae bacterium]